MLECCQICCNFESVQKLVRHTGANLFNGCPKFARNLPQVVLNWKQIQKIYYHLKIGNHRLTIATWFIQGYPYPPNSPFFPSYNFWLHKAKNTIQCFSLSVCLCAYIYIYIYIVMQQKLFSVIYQIKYCRSLVKISFNFESVQKFVRC